MPRNARLDVPNMVHHVMARGIDGCDIFRNDSDRYSFLKRLSDIVTHSGRTSLYAWALMSNHFHLLIRPEGDVHLATLMQRLMTGYAVNFNKCHKRKGHLFQNRYKSIVVEEDQYFLELVRYIHLNPVRAGIVRSVGKLNAYEFTGHAVLIGKRKFQAQNTDEVLLRFSDQRSTATKLYSEFVAEGFEQGVREELRGGGLIRSSGGVTGVLARGQGEREAADERILGLGNFVETVLKRSDSKKKPDASTVEDILVDVARRGGVTREQIIGPDRTRRVSKVRREFYLRAEEETGATAALLGRITGRAHVSVSRAIEIAKQERAGSGD